MKLVVTGALGHIGSKLIRDAATAFASPTIELVDNLSTMRFSSLFALPTMASYRFTQRDVTKDDLSDRIRGADVVIHLAALTDAPSSVGRAKEFFDNNLGGTQRVADQCAALRVPLILVSSTSVYGSASDKVDETASGPDLKPQSPYAECKLAEERLVQGMTGKGLKSAIVRLGTIFGTSPGMRFHTAVNRFCWQACLGQPLSVWKTAMYQVRPYCDLSDATAALFFLIKKEAFTGGIYNVVTTNVNVDTLVKEVRRWVPQVKVNLVDDAIMNQLSFEVKSEKIQRIGFTAGGSLSRGIEETISLLKNMNSAQEVPIEILRHTANS